MHKLIRETLLSKLDNPVLRELADAAVINYKERIAFTTDSFVVSPLFFPGGDIGKLAVCGTVNDLVMVGAIPEYLSLGLIVEEGLEHNILERIIDSIADAASKARVYIATGDFKVVEKGACDKIFINASGVGRIIKNKQLSIKNIKPKDRIIITGNIAEHGLAVLSQRKGSDLGFSTRSDCSSLGSLLIPILKKTDAISFMRDPTRGGVATTLNEIAEASGYGMMIEERRLPIASRVRAACELLGIDPLYMANEGKAVLVVREHYADKITAMLKQHPLGRNARIVGEIIKSPGPDVILKTTLGTERIVDMLTSEPLPRIC